MDAFPILFGPEVREYQHHGVFIAVKRRFSPLPAMHHDHMAVHVGGSLSPRPLPRSRRVDWLTVPTASKDKCPMLRA